MRRHLWALLVPVALVAGGTLGYRLVEGWPVFDALYMTVITLTTVGFMEVHPLTEAGRAFTMLLTVGGVFTMLYAATALIGAVVSGEIRGSLGRQRMERRLAELVGHTIVCGYGRMGRLVCQEFSRMGLPFVLVDRQAGVLADFDLPHGIALHGDATDDAVLRRAGVERARSLVTVAASDADNLYITMSARLLSEKLLIVARSEEPEAEKKLLRAGASRVVSPYAIGGRRVAQAVLRPNVMDFIELATRSDYLELQMEEVSIEAASAISGKTVKDSRLRRDLGIILVAIRKPGGKMVFNPPAEATLEAEDVLICLGHRAQLEKLEAITSPGRAAR